MKVRHKTLIDNAYVVLDRSFESTTWMECKILFDMREHTTIPFVVRYEYYENRVYPLGFKTYHETIDSAIENRNLVLANVRKFGSIEAACNAIAA